MNFSGIISRYNLLRNKSRIVRLRLLGCTIGQGCTIGKISVTGHKRILIGNFVRIQDNVRLSATNYANSTNEHSIIISDNNFIGYGSIIDANQYIEIQSNCMFGPYCYVTDSNHVHNLNDSLFRLSGGTYKSVIIKSNCWIGTHSIILPGVTVNENSVIAANSTVLKNVNKCSMNAGSPSVEKKNNQKNQEELNHLK